MIDAPPLAHSTTPNARRIRRPEVLAPAGTEEMMRAAVENGADAVYFGLQRFNARMRAANFDTKKLPETMRWLHERGVRGYVTLNTLVFNSELDGMIETLRICSDSGVDAVLVQDLGVAALAARLVPDLPVHASTQMTLTSAESVRGAEDGLGLVLDRVVTARELSKRELAKMVPAAGREIEVFVHGAICVAYSGQCLTSEALGGRSANRGECAQACRLPYDLVVDGTTRALDDVKYLLSPKDLAAYEDIGDLTRLGIVSFKIEGRLKSPQYVAATVQSYRAAIDAVFGPEGLPTGSPVMDEPTRRKLEMTFSRGFTGGYIHETNHQVVVEGRFPKKRGLFLGRVTRTAPDGVWVMLEGPLKPGDGIVFDSGRPDEDEEGGRVYEMFRGHARATSFDPLQNEAEDTEHRLTFGDGALNMKQIRRGDRVWKTSDPALDAELAASYAAGRVHYQRPVDALVRGRVGEALELTLTDWDGLSVTAADTEVAGVALKRPLSAETLAEHIGRLGNTPFRLGGLRLELEGSLMVPFSRLNELRRRAVEALLEKRRAIGTGRRFVEDALEELRRELSGIAAAEWTAGEASIPSDDDPVLKNHYLGPVAGRREVLAARSQVRPGEVRLGVLCRSLEQVEASLRHGAVETIYTDFEDIRLHREARAMIPAGAARFVPSTLRILKPGEAPIARKVLEAAPDAVLVRGLGQWQVLREARPTLPLIADYSLNVANDLTARLLHHHGLEYLTASYDLNIDQMLDMFAHAPTDWFEVTLHQYMPMFHMEHCVFCRFLSTGTDYTNCGRPCEKHEVALKDRVGQSHPIKADAGCRNTVFNAVAQSGAAYLPQLLGAGIRRFRIDFLNEKADGVARVIDTYLPALRGEVDGRELWRSLRAKSKLGVTKGSLDHE